MKFSTVFTATFALGTAVLAQQVVTPASDPLALELSQRNLDGLYELQERDLFSIVEGLFSSINYTSILDSIDYESIAGWTNNLLVENNNIEYLDNILNFLGDTDLVPFAVSYLLSNNETRNIVGEVVIEALPLIKDIDPTPIFVALKNSGLAYVLVADLIKIQTLFHLLNKLSLICWMKVPLAWVICLADLLKLQLLLLPLTH